MRSHVMLVTITIVAFGSACAKRAPEPTGVAPGTPHVSWIIMSGDRDNPDQEFVCQSEPRNDCIVPVSRPDRQVFSDVHFYYHGTGTETTYSGTIDIGFFQGPTGPHPIAADTTVTKAGSNVSHSVTGIVSATSGEYALRLALVATAAGSGKGQSIQEEVAIVVK